MQATVASLWAGDLRWLFVPELQLRAYWFVFVFAGTVVKLLKHHNVMLPVEQLLRKARGVLTFLSSCETPALGSPRKVLVFSVADTMKGFHFLHIAED